MNGGPRFEVWRDGDWHVGHLVGHPERTTRARSLTELYENLLDIWDERKQEAASNPLLAAQTPDEENREQTPGTSEP